MAWEKLGSTKLTVKGDTITVDTLPERNNLMVEIFAINDSDININIIFNNDANTVYARRRSNNGAADSTDTSQPQLEVYGNTLQTRFQYFMISNTSDQEKLVLGSNNQNTAGASTAPDRTEWVGKWSNTSDAITRIDVFNTGSGSYDVDSEVTVYGSGE